eukprot:6836039-Pyramimonas_sp.AAC.1
MHPMVEPPIPLPPQRRRIRDDVRPQRDRTARITCVRWLHRSPMPPRLLLDQLDHFGRRHVA